MGEELERFVGEIEAEFEEYKRYCQNPDEVGLVFGDYEVLMVHAGQIVRRWDNPFNNEMLD